MRLAAEGQLGVHIEPNKISILPFTNNQWQYKCPSTGKWIDECEISRAMEYFTVVKMNDLELFLATWINIKKYNIEKETFQHLQGKTVR